MRIIQQNYFTHKCIILITPRYFFFIGNVVILNYDECKSLTLRSKNKRASKHVRAQKLVLFLKTLILQQISASLNPIS